MIMATWLSRVQGSWRTAVGEVLFCMKGELSRSVRFSCCKIGSDRRSRPTLGSIARRLEIA